LVSDGSVLHLSNLPVFTSRTSTEVKIHVRSHQDPPRILFEESEELFSDIDGDAIRLSALPLSAAILLRSQGAQHLNVALLGHAEIMGYLQRVTDQGQSPAETGWIKRFWTWLPGSRLEHEIMQDSVFDTLCLMPCHGVTELRSVIDSLFAWSPDADLASALQQIGYWQVQSDFPTSASALLLRHGKLHRSEDLKALLTHVPETIRRIPDRGLADTLRRHVVSLMMRTTAKKSLAPFFRRKARCLPIFDVADVADGSSAFGPVTQDQTIVGVSESVRLLPAVEGMAFVRDLEPSLARNLNPPLYENGKLLTAAEVAVLWIEHLETQTPEAQLAFLTDVVRQHAALPRSVIQHLQNAVFVRTASGISRAPAALLDPQCDIAVELYDPHSDCVPYTGDPAHIGIVTALRQLNVLRNTISVDIFLDRVQWIADATRSTDARYRKSLALLQLVRRHRYDGQGLKVDASAAWLPTEAQTLSTAADCFDSRLHNRALFDRAAHVLPVEVSSTMRKVLGLDTPIPLSVILRQMSCVLEAEQANKFDYMHAILEELGMRESWRELGEPDILSLLELTRSSQWIPIRPGLNAGTPFGVFRLPFAESSGLPFHSIPSVLSGKPGVRSLLKRLGCSEEYVTQRKS
jgi:hypothetical protein